MNKKELIKLLDKYEIEYEITDNTKEVEEGLRLLDKALEKIGIIIPKETQVDTITTENDTEVPKYTTEWASSSDLISRQAAIEAVEKAVFKGVAKSAIKSLPPVEPVAKNATPTDEVVDFNNMISAGGRIRNLPTVEPKPVEDAIRQPVMTEEVREAIMRLTMCAREECFMCKYENSCGFDKQVEMATENMNTILKAFTRC